MTPTEERTNLYRSLCEMEKHPSGDFNSMRVESLRYAAARFVREEKAALKVARITH